MKQRQIKFRAWNPAMNEMIMPEMLFINTESDDGTCSLYSTILNLQENFELMQFTGLSDKNGVEIFEGDIVKYRVKRFADGDEEPDNHGLYPDSKDAFDVVEFRGGAFEASKSSFGWEGETLISLPDTEVVGNIFQNSELITK